MGYVIAIQEDGQRLRYEYWVYLAWRDGSVIDPLLMVGLDSAVRLYESHN